MKNNWMSFGIERLMIVVAALWLFLSPPARGSSAYANGFETDITGWFAPARVASGTNGIVSKSGAYHAESVAGSFTRWGAYSSVFPVGGYTTSLDVYLDLGTASPNDTRFDFSSAISTPAGGHRRDFVITGGFYNDSDVTGTGPRFVFSASNNTPGWPKNPGRSPFAVVASGWYSIEHRFYDSGGGVLAVTITLRDSGGAPLTSWTLSDATDVIGITVGGNRYGWFITNGFPFLAIDNTELRLAPKNLFATGFDSPMDRVVSVKKKSNRILPFKMQILDSNGVPQSDADIAPPVIEVRFDSVTYGGVDGDDLLSSGRGDEGNQFSYNSADQMWQFNLSSKQFSAPGSYEVKAISGDGSAYTFASPIGLFVIE